MKRPASDRSKSTPTLVRAHAASVARRQDRGRHCEWPALAAPRLPVLPMCGQSPRRDDGHAVVAAFILRRMVQDVSSVAAVRRFSAALREVRGCLLADLSPVANVADLLAAVRSRRDLPREGVTSSGIQYTVHGAGCRMIAADGREVDVDLVTDPLLGHTVEAFDAWRIRQFLGKADNDEHSNEDILEACTRLANEGYLREVAARHWFALPEAPADPADA